MASLLVLADDLTGAADTGAGFASAGLRTVLELGTKAVVGRAARPESPLEASPGSPASAVPDVLCIDTDTRGSDPDAAAPATRRAIHARPATHTYLKVDSTLRGNIGVQLASALEETGCDIALFAPAFPATGRTTVDGRQLVHGAALSTTDTWMRETAQAPARVADVLRITALPATHIGLTDVRAGPERVPELLLASHQQGTRVAVCDACTDTDLAVVAAAGARCGLRVLWAGTGGLARQLPAALGLAAGMPGTAWPAACLVARNPAHARGRTRLLAVIGSATTTAHAQARTLVGAGFTEIQVPAAALLEGDAARCTAYGERAARAARRGDAVLTVGGGELIRTRGAPGRASSALGEIAAAAVPDCCGLLLTGGETARAVLSSAGVTRLRIVGEADPGIVVSVTEGSLRVPVVTKAGAFGDSGSLLRAGHVLAGPGMTGG